MKTQHELSLRVSEDDEFPSFKAGSVGTPTFAQSSTQLTHYTKFGEQTKPKTTDLTDHLEDSTQASSEGSSGLELSFDTSLSQNLESERPSKKSKKAKGQPKEKSPTEDWKRKVKTEFCKFWLKGLECENQSNG